MKLSIITDQNSIKRVKIDPYISMLGFELVSSMIIKKGPGNSTFEISLIQVKNYKKLLD